MNLYEKYLEEAGIKYEDLNPAEKETFNQKTFDIKNLSIADVKQHIIDMKNAVALQVSDIHDTEEDLEKDLIDNIGESIPDIKFFETSGEYSGYPDLDQQFHMDLLRMLKRQWLFRVIDHLDPIFHMLRLITLQEIERIRSSIEEHRKIVDALRLNDLAAAITSMQEHWNSALKALEQKHRSVPGLFL